LRSHVARPYDARAIDIGFVIDPLKSIVVFQVVADEDQVLAGNCFELLRDRFAVFDPDFRAAPRNEVWRLGWWPAAREGRGVSDDQRAADRNREANNRRAKARLREIAESLDDEQK